MLHCPNNSLWKGIKQTSPLIFHNNSFIPGKPCLLHNNLMGIRQIYWLTVSKFTRCNKRELHFAMKWFWMMGTFERQVRIWGQIRSCPGEICCSVPLCLQLFLHVGQSTELEAEVQTFKIPSVPFSTRQSSSQVCSGWLWQWQCHTMTSGSQDAQEGSLECVISCLSSFEVYGSFQTSSCEASERLQAEILKCFLDPSGVSPPWAHEQQCLNNSARKAMRWWMHFLAPFFCCFCRGRAQTPSWCFKSPISWWIWPLGFSVACECGWWPVMAYSAVRHLLCPSKGKPWVMVMPHSALMSGLD